MINALFVVLEALAGSLHYLHSLANGTVSFNIRNLAAFHDHSIIYSP